MRNRKRTWREAGVTIEQVHSRCREDCDCLIWTGATFSGHPKLRNTSARRIVWELTNGPIPAGRIVTTTCGHPSCLLPGHLELTTKARAATESAMRPDVLLRKSVSNARAARSRRATITEAIYCRADAFDCACHRFPTPLHHKTLSPKSKKPLGELLSVCGHVRVTPVRNTSQRGLRHMPTHLTRGYRRTFHDFAQDVICTSHAGTFPARTRAL